ncbi:hypothetical protein [Sphaerisporangium aureirubrum]|uniref:hypothetical protein n=1 Tax=Sphaerisporangium aureirubrum TaxID=1544736 RepID=UPI00362F3D9B
MRVIATVTTPAAPEAPTPRTGSHARPHIETPAPRSLPETTHGCVPLISTMPDIP